MTIDKFSFHTGIVGSFNSGKSALVHRYLTGSYMMEESPEGGRFKKEIQIDNQSYLLLIRDEGEAPEIQVSDIFNICTYYTNNATLIYFFSSPHGLMQLYSSLVWKTKQVSMQFTRIMLKCLATKRLTFPLFSWELKVCSNFLKFALRFLQFDFHCRST